MKPLSQILPKKRISTDPYGIINKTQHHGTVLDSSLTNKSTVLLAKHSKSVKHLGNQKHKFIQGEHSIFAKDFEDDHSKVFIDQSSSLMNFSSIEDERLDDDTDKTNPKIAQLITINKSLDDIISQLDTPDRDTLLNMLERLADEAKEVKENFLILLKCMELNAKIVRDLGDYAKSVGIFKLMRVYCNFARLHDKKLAIYKFIIDTYIQMREYNHALTFCKKMLRLSWVLNDPDYEITAYDKIGLLFYYNGDLVQADFFHEKACSNDREPKNSQIRKMGESLSQKSKKGRSSYQQNYYETDSEDEFELGMFSNNYASSRRYEDEVKEQNTTSLPSIKYRIPIPRKLTQHVRQMQELGRVDVPFARKQTFLEGEQDTKLIYNQMSLNRNLKNFLIQQYVNHAFWSSTQDQLEKIKFYHLHRNIKNHLALIQRIKKLIKQQKRNYKLENVLGGSINSSNINPQDISSLPQISSPTQQLHKDLNGTFQGNNLNIRNITDSGQPSIINSKKSRTSLPRIHNKI